MALRQRSVALRTLSHLDAGASFRVMVLRRDECNSAVVIVPASGAVLCHVCTVCCQAFWGLKSKLRSDQPRGGVFRWRSRLSPPHWRQVFV